ncbi:hypothetical protein HY605_04405 [Candidatus Peregrinibacteria bacterium]|nr:hypothetical protein [Candidatus Peregrinibacteria bacterium]
MDNIKPIGTGPYKLSSWNPGVDLSMRPFDDYWGAEPKFEKVTLLERPSKNERVNMFLQGEADFLAFVPFDAVQEVEKRAFKIRAIPSLEVQFLLFNFNSPIFQDLEKRKAFSSAIDQDALVKEVGGYARPVSQFIANGVLGYNPDIAGHVFDINSDEVSLLDGETLQFHIPVGLDVLGEHVRTQLEKLGVSVIVSYLEWDDLTQSMENAEADLYFLGFKSEIGDAADFFDVVVKSGADFNVGSYSNPEVDRMIANAMTSLDPTIRLSSLQDAMKIIVEEDIIGVPLFEYETLYAMVHGIDFEPRIDGFIYFDDIILE